VLVLVAVAVGAAGVGNRLAHDGAAGSAGASGQPTRVWHRPEPVKVDATRPTPLTRPLALVYQAVAGGRLFIRDANGKPMLVTDGDLDLPFTRVPPEPAKAGKSPDGAKLAAPCGDIPAASTPRVQVVDKPTCEAVRQVRAALDREGGRLTTVIATLPDWVDSSLKWTFDDQLDALQTASSQLDYSFVAFDLPDSEPVTIASSEEPPRFPVAKLHESTPGSLLFRKRSTDAKTCPEWLQILLVGETPTGGVHEEALVSAIHFVQLWNLPPLAAPSKSTCTPAKDRIDNSANAIRIIGPTYSGSAESMAHSLRVATASATIVPTSYDIVTPSASSPDNRTLLTIPGVSQFRSVVHSDDHVLDGLASFLGRSRPEWQCGFGVALLVESSTSWGQRLLRNSANANTGNTCTLCMDRTELHPQPPMPCAVIVPFPLHISRLRADAKAPVTLPVQVPDGATVALNLSESGAPVDRVPPMTPELTAATVELMVDGMFQAIDDRRSTAIGVLATDKRDHIFLAEQIARHRPNVLMFTLESNLIYLHPDVAPYTRGTIVGSTYALSERAQRLTHPALALKYPQQFGSSAGHGEFNALAMILGRPELMLAYDVPGALADPVPGDSYGGPCRPDAPGGVCTPPVWISVVGHRALLPVAAEHVRTEAAPGPGGPTDGVARDGELTKDPYITAVSSPNHGDPAHARDYLKGTGAPLISILALIALTCWHAWHWVRPRKPEAEAARTRAGERPPGQERDRAVGLTAAALDEATAATVAVRGVLTAALLWLAKLAVVYVGDATGHWSGAAQLLYGLAAGVASAPLLYSILARLVTSDAGQPMAGLMRVLTVVYGVVACLSFLDAWVPAWVAGLLLVACAMLDYRRDNGWTAGRLRRIPVLLGTGAYVCFVSHLIRDDWGTVEAVLYVERASLLTSLASPTTVILLLLGAMYWWATWNLRRVQLLLVPEIEVGVGRFLSERAERSGIQGDDLLRRPAMTVKDLLWLPLVAAFIGLGWGYWNVGTIEGRLFNGFLLLASVCVATTFAHSLAHTWTLGRSVRRLLMSLGMHGASTRYVEIGKESFRWQLTFSPVRWRELEPFVRRIGNVVTALRQWPGEEAARLSQSPTFISDLIKASTDACKVDVAGGEAAAYAKDLTADHWARLDKLMDAYVAVLRKTRWADLEPPIAVSPAAADALIAMEYVVLFHAAIVLRDLLTRLVSGFTAVLGGLLLLFATHLFYTFQGRLFWLGFDALAVGGSALFAIRMLLVLERDTTLSRLWGTTPGELSLFGGLTLRAGVYAAISGVTLFAVFFPEVAGQLAGWLLPLKALVP
jgi:hypothetical protein